MTQEIVLPAALTGEPAPIRIAFCITDLDIGGAENIFVELVTRLDRARWEPEVFCLGQAGKLAEKLRDYAIPVTCFGANSIRDLGVIWRLAAALKRFQPALLQCFLFHANLIGRLAAWWSGVPVVICGIRVAERRSRLRLWMDRITRCFVDHNVCVSHAVAAFSIQQSGLNPAKVSVIQNAVDYERFANAMPLDRTSLGFSADSPLILFVGRLDPQKAPFVLLQAFDDLLKRFPGWQLLLVGDGPLRTSIEEWISTKGFAERVRVAGFRPDIPALLKTADVLVLPSLWEGMPNIVLEAMAAGLPVVATRVEGSEELIEDGKSGLLTSPGSIAELEQRIEVMLTHRQLASGLAEEAQQRVAKRFTFEAMIAGYEHLYETMIDTSERKVTRTSTSKKS